MPHQTGSVVIGAAGLAVFGLDQIDQPNIVVRPDALAEFVKQFDHGEGLLGCPVIGVSNGIATTAWLGGAALPDRS
jgi:hypothetical protein